MAQLFNSENFSMWLAVLRHTLTALLSSVVTSGILTQNEAEALTGAILLMVPIGWAAVERYREMKAAKVAKKGEGNELPQ
jgi:hypothetical protein